MAAWISGKCAVMPVLNQKLSCTLQISQKTIVCISDFKLIHHFLEELCRL